MVFIIIITLTAIVLIAVIIVRPTITEVKGGKVLAFLAFFTLPIITIAIGTSAHLEKSKSTDFCLSCHVMEPYGESLYIDGDGYLPANHFQNKRIPAESACFTCHTTYTMYGDLQAKLRGLKHVVVNYLGKIPEKIELYDPYENRECLHCHDGARSFEEHPVHSSMLTQFKDEELSCLECHVLTHSVAELEGLKLWQRGKQD